MKMKIFNLSVVALISLLVLCGCSEQSGQNLAETQEPAPAGEQAASEPLTIEIEEETGEEAPARPAQSFEVLINTKAFEPEEITIQAGDTVIWRKIDNLQHRIASDDNLFFTENQLYDNGTTFSFTFEEPGTYGYRDVVFGTRGTVKVE